MLSWGQALASGYVLEGMEIFENVDRKYLSLVVERIDLTGDPA